MMTHKKGSADAITFVYLEIEFRSEENIDTQKDEKKIKTQNSATSPDSEERAAKVVQETSSFRAMEKVKKKSENGRLCQISLLNISFLDSI